MNAEVFHEESFQFLVELSEIELATDRDKHILKYITEQQNKETLDVNEFDEDLQWFNVNGKLSLEKLKHKIVVLDFFTYCCINCMHILPDLEEVEKEYLDTDGVVVVGVHSAKFDNEKDSANILNSILRYNITHPVVNDDEASMWSNLQINCWPTVVILGPGSRPLVALIGEGHRRILLDFVRVAVNYYDELLELDYDCIDTKFTRDSLPPTPIRFPGKVNINKSGSLIAISDSGHHRIVIIDDNGIVQYHIGNGSTGLEDGNFESCKFHSPQGVSWSDSGKYIYVADTENHAVRKIDLEKKHVETLVGTGVQGHDTDGGQQGITQEISSPWDLCMGSSLGSDKEDLLLIAMAGTHQIWIYFLDDGKWLKGKQYEKGTCVRFAGNGNEENRNNSYPQNAAFAQPSGICTGYMSIKGEAVEHIFIADSESSSIRSISLKDGSVKAVVGGERDPRNLFAFGDEDGKGVDAKLQHPLGVVMKNITKGNLIVADSYNHKLKLVDVNAKECHTLPLFASDEKLLNEPGGICMHPSGEKLYIADTNNHQIKVYDFRANTIQELPITETYPNSAFTMVDASQVQSVPPSNKIKHITNKRAAHIKQDPIEVIVGEKLTIELQLNLEAGLHITDDAPSACQILMEDANIFDFLESTSLQKQEIKDTENSYEFQLVIPKSCDTTKHPRFELETMIYYCDDAGVCMMKGTVYNIHLHIKEDQNQTDNKTQPKAFKHSILQAIDRTG